MAKKAAKIKIKLLNPETGTFYVTKKNPRTHTEKFSFTRYDKKTRKHETFTETKIK